MIDFLVWLLLVPLFVVGAVVTLALLAAFGLIMLVAFLLFLVVGLPIAAIVALWDSVTGKSEETRKCAEPRKFFGQHLWPPSHPEMPRRPLPYPRQLPDTRYFDIVGDPT